MAWLDEGLKFLENTFSPSVQDVEGKKFSNKPFTEIKAKLDPLCYPFNVNTLGALRDLIAANAEKITGQPIPLIHIVNHTKVQLLSGQSDTEGRRCIVAEATPAEYEGFEFDEYQGLDEFIVGVHAHFAPTPDRDYLVAISSKVVAGDVLTSEDDGVSQQVTVNASLALKGTEKLRPRVTLRPFRTFPEVDQPESEFILRAQKDGNAVELALFEADGGKWKIAAVQNIAFYLRNLQIKLPIIA